MTLDPLSALTAPLSPEAFLSARWPELPHLGQGEVDRFGPFAAEALQRLASAAALPHEHARVFYLDQEGRPAQLQVPAEVAVRLAADLGHTVCLSMVQVPGASDWLGPLEARLGLPRGSTVCHLYSSSSGGGVRLHCDDAPKFIVQLRGRKRWRLAPNEQEPHPLRALVPELSTRTDLPRALDETWSYELGPGAALYLPHGWWHETDAAEPSISLSLSFSAPRWADVVAEALRRRLLREPRWRARSHGLWGARGPQQEAARAELRGMAHDLEQALGDGGLARLLGVAPPFEPKEPR